MLTATGCDWVFKAMKGFSTDYHQEMNAVNFEKWFEEKLLPALPANSLIVMDNASYHRFTILCLLMLKAFTGGLLIVATWRRDQNKRGVKHSCSSG